MRLPGIIDGLMAVDYEMALRDGLIAKAAQFRTGLFNISEVENGIDPEELRFDMLALGEMTTREEFSPG